MSLATGEGKSLIFQLIAQVGFAGTDPSEPGLTLVVVPTVALAINHENAALEKGLKEPIAYRSGNNENNQALIARIDHDAQALCVASPEAVCGPLRRSIAAAAERGRLRAVVVDEAHLIDGWGTGFRTEFQSLSGLRHQWMRAAPPGTAPRTNLLSATLTAATVNLLRTLFAGPGEFQLLSALRLRGEPDYWTVACPTEVHRAARVLEAFCHVPRPAILYVTRVVDAKTWRERLKAEGFEHVEMVHGETGINERDRILRAWRDGEIDLVVATSAFGLGIDYRHVRAVIHAVCPRDPRPVLPGGGRGGRDGRSCLALTFHTPGDIAIAERISAALVISIDRGRQRWGAMFEQRIPTDEPDTYILPLDIAPSQEPEDIDMRGERNSDWNARVLTLMARAEMVQLFGVPTSSEERLSRQEVVRVLDLEHDRKSTWRRRVQPVRQRLAAASQNNLDLMRRFLTGQTCPAPLLLSLYSAGPEAHACSRCAACRRDSRQRQPERPRLEPASPWPPPRALAPALATAFPRTNLGHQQPERRKRSGGSGRVRSSPARTKTDGAFRRDRFWPGFHHRAARSWQTGSILPPPGPGRLNVCFGNSQTSSTSTRRLRPPSPRLRTAILILSISSRATAFALHRPAGCQSGTGSTAIDQRHREYSQQRHRHHSRKPDRRLCVGTGAECQREFDLLEYVAVHEPVRHRCAGAPASADGLAELGDEARDRCGGHGIRRVRRCAHRHPAGATTSTTPTSRTRA